MVQSSKATSNRDMRTIVGSALYILAAIAIAAAFFHDGKLHVTHMTRSQDFLATVATLSLGFGTLLLHWNNSKRYIGFGLMLLGVVMGVLYLL